MAVTFEIPKTKEEVISKTRSIFQIEPLYPGYGSTLGNALRRVLLSSMPGTAITSIKLEGVTHEFSAISHVKEDMIEIIMNLRKINFKSHSKGPVAIELSAKGPKTISAKNFKSSSEVEILNPEQHIATLDKNAVFELEVTLEQGRGFLSTEERSVDKTDIGRINIDSVFSPVRLVNFKVENTRVGQMTNYDKIELEVETNGTVTPKEVLTKSANILVEHFAEIAEGKSESVLLPELAESADVEGEISKMNPKTKVEELNLSARSVNALLMAGVKTIAGLRRMSDLKLSEVKGLGKKGFEEVKELISQ
ncbi:MAG: DNA-directed RNA polymerase subunit alpha [Candidatus Berkelbacteria bacterium]|nr:DNA-directed RNA polymerase subunit alpha [Candidatus Berkelbacteria bacterium]